jgi:hypothetical protein
MSFPVLHHYILRADKLAVPEPDLLKWAVWMSDVERRQIAVDEIDGYRISTVFMGIDHDFLHQGDPLLFETMVFPPTNRGWEESYMERYASWADAAAGHRKIKTLLDAELRQAQAETTDILARLAEKRHENQA